MSPFANPYHPHPVADMTQFVSPVGFSSIIPYDAATTPFSEGTFFKEALDSHPSLIGSSQFIKAESPPADCSALHLAAPQTDNSKDEASPPQEEGTTTGSKPGDLTATRGRRRKSSATSRKNSSDSNSSSTSNKSVARSEDLDEENLPKDPRRRRILERNRIAATKCRLRKRDEASALANKEQEMEDQNRNLYKQFEALSNEIYSLKEQLLRHTDCSCTLIQKYIANEAKKSVDLMSSRPSIGTRSSSFSFSNGPSDSPSPDYASPSAVPSAAPSVASMGRLNSPAHLEKNITWANPEPFQHQVPQQPSSSMTMGSTPDNSFFDISMEALQEVPIGPSDLLLGTPVEGLWAGGMYGSVGMTRGLDMSWDQLAYT